MITYLFSSAPSLSYSFPKVKGEIKGDLKGEKEGPKSKFEMEVQGIKHNLPFN